MNYCNKLNEIFNWLKLQFPEASLRQDFFAFQATVGQLIELKDYNEINLEVVDGEFTIENTMYNLPAENPPGVTVLSGGTIIQLISMSSDGASANPSISSGATKGWNSGKIARSNVYLIECVRAGTINIDLRR